MKRFAILVCLALGLAIALPAQQASTQYQHIGYAWAQAGSTAPLCSTTVTKSCGVGYQLTLTDPSGAVQSPIAIAWPSTSYTYGPGGFLYCGDWKASLVLSYKDDQGAAQSATATSTTTVSCPFVLSPPSGLKGTPAA